ncbi:hypothetical protein ACJ72_03615 [Emergomyces africanus]|uniref:Uncharacterized protein n=1 Tax=Emergomyces africanus TaxID=1955775 RepID=A0A1B7NZ31_9EURO|nr:hypothetical protein ACJ72_03615 [Emergomyces africanus]
MPSASRSNPRTNNNDPNSNNINNNTTNNPSLATRLGLSLNISSANKDSKYSPLDTNIPPDEATFLTPGSSGEDRGRHSIRARVAGTSGASSSLLPGAAGASSAGGAGDPSLLRSPLRGSFQGGSGIGSGGAAAGDANANNDSSMSSSSSLRRQRACRRQVYYRGVFSLHRRRRRRWRR